MINKGQTPLQSTGPATVPTETNPGISEGPGTSMESELGPLNTGGATGPSAPTAPASPAPTGPTTNSHDGGVSSEAYLVSI